MSREKTFNKEDPQFLRIDKLSGILAENSMKGGDNNAK